MPEAPTLHVLLAPPDGPAPGTPLPPDDAEPALAPLYAYPDADVWVRANMISTLDGAATGADGRSGSINGPADLRVFTVLRALADVVLVGAGTVRAEGYRAPWTRPGLRALRTGRPLPEHPDLAVVSRAGDVPAEALAGPRPPWVFTTAAAPGLPALRRALPADRLHVHDDEVDLPRVVRTLAAAGLRRVLCEGGPALLATLLAADLVDELCLTQAPVLVGGPAPRPVATATWLLPPVAAAPSHLLHSGGVLLGRWALRHDHAGPGAAPVAGPVVGPAAGTLPAATA